MKNMDKIRTNQSMNPHKKNGKSMKGANDEN